MYIERTKDRIFTSAVNRIEEYAKNNYNLSSTSTVRAFLEMISSELSDISTITSSAILNKTLDTATGNDLDLIGKILGVTRLTAETATASEYSTIKIHIDPSFNYNVQNLVNKISADIISIYINRTTPSITIKAGTILYTTKSGMTYSTIEDVTLAGDDTYLFVNGISSHPGKTGNLSVGGIIAHNIEKNQPELSEISQYLLVTNIAPIDNGQNVESDTNYRYRLASSLLSAANANRTAIRIAAFSVPGVADIKIIPFINGLGSTGIEIITTDPITNIGTLRAVKDACNTVVAAGETIEVVEPEYSSVSITVKVITFDSNIDSSIINNIKRNTIDYILNIPKGGTIIKNEIINIAMSQSNQIKDVSITDMRVGSLDIVSGSTLNLYPITPGNISCSKYEKWYTDTILIEVVSV